jgi:hypothetical protein
MADRSLLRLSTTLVVIGEVLFALVTLFHPGREDPNNHPAVFAEYASSGSWIAVHFGQFVLMAVLLAGLLVLSFALNVRSGVLGWVGRFAAVSVVVALALYGVVQAVDGVANKHAVDAWASAPEAEKAARFASAETMRWLEWGTSSYQTFMFALTLILLATVIVWTARGRHSIPRAKLGARNRGLRDQLVSRGPLGRRLTPYACVEHLASHSRLADEGARSTWKKANLSGAATTT